MLPLIALLAGLMGMTLGLLGGGGSILAVPLLLYVASVPPKVAIATSLLVVGATSSACALQHARSGHVRWRTGLVFGSVAMVGAYIGGLLSVFVPGSVLLLLFAGMMVAAGVAMLRPSRVAKRRAAPAPLWKIAAEGLVVGAFTGLVGAGGGFLVVPALVLLGGLDMRSAVGTSTLVITMKSFAGFAGHAAHVPIDWGLAATVTAFAVVGSVAGAQMLRRVDPARLKKAFGGFVFVMAGVIAVQQVPNEVLQSVFADHWVLWVSGAGLGLWLLASMTSLFNRRRPT